MKRYAPRKRSLLDVKSGEICQRTGCRTVKKESRRTPGLKAVVKRLLPRAHLDDTDEFLFYLGLAVKQRKQRAEVLANQLRLVLGCSVQRAERNLADTLSEAADKGPRSARCAAILRSSATAATRTRSLSCMSERNSTMKGARMSS
jgi:hypothetical protein